MMIGHPASTVVARAQHTRLRGADVLGLEPGPHLAVAFTCERRQLDYLQDAGGEGVIRVLGRLFSGGSQNCRSYSLCPPIQNHVTVSSSSIPSARLPRVMRSIGTGGKGFLARGRTICGQFALRFQEGAHRLPRNWEGFGISQPVEVHVGRLPGRYLFTCFARSGL